MNKINTTDRVTLLERKIERERAARNEAERLLERKSRDLYTIYEELRRTSEQTKAVMNSIGECVVLFAQDGTIETYNKLLLDIFDLDEQTVPMNIAYLLEPAQGKEFLNSLARYLEGGDKAFANGKLKEVIGIRNDAPFPAEVSVREFKLSNGKKFVASLRDITQRKVREQEQETLKQELMQAHKMESVGHLAGGIAHEINTPIQYVGDNLRFLKESFGKITGALNSFQELCSAALDIADIKELAERTRQQADDVKIDFILSELPDAADEALDGAEHVARIVQAMKEFAHPGSKEPEAMQFNKAVKTTLTVSRNEWKDSAEIALDLAEDIPEITCLPGEISQVFLNLIVNAAHAIEAKGDGAMGTITIQTSYENDMAVFRVSDTGTGIPEHVQGQIFEPFFTTKEVGKGTGQGLAIARDIVARKHGGALDFETTMGEGTTFIVKLPLKFAGIVEEEEFPSDNDPQKVAV
mgnify:CR=1 FL=1